MPTAILGALRTAGSFLAKSAGSLAKNQASRIPGAVGNGLTSFLNQRQQNDREQTGEPLTGSSLAPIWSLLSFVGINKQNALLVALIASIPLITICVLFQALSTIPFTTGL